MADPITADFELPPNDAYPQGRKLEIQADNEDQLNQIMTNLSSKHRRAGMVARQTGAPPPPEGFVGPIDPNEEDLQIQNAGLMGVGDVLKTVLGNAALQIPAGVAGAVSGAMDLAGSGNGPTKGWATKAYENVMSHAPTPETAVGSDILGKVGDVSDKAGQLEDKYIVGPLGGEASPTWGAILHTGLVMGASELLPGAGVTRSIGDAVTRRMAISSLKNDLADRFGVVPGAKNIKEQIGQAAQDIVGPNATVGGEVKQIGDKLRYEYQIKKQENDTAFETAKQYNAGIRSEAFDEMSLRLQADWAQNNTFAVDRMPKVKGYLTDLSNMDKNPEAASIGATQPVDMGMVRYYSGGGSTFTASLPDAKMLASRNGTDKLSYVDIPEGSPLRGEGDPASPTFDPRTVMPPEIVRQKQSFIERPPPPTSSVTPFTRIQYVEGLRERLNKDIRGSKADPVQQSALIEIKKNLDNTMSDQFDQDMILGEPGALDAWREAYKSRAETRSLFPVDENKNLKKLITKNNATGYDLKRYLFNRNSIGGKIGTGETVKNLIGIFGADSPEVAGLGREMTLDVVEPLLGEKPDLGQFVYNYEKSKKENGEVLQQLNPYSDPGLETLVKISKSVLRHGGEPEMDINMNRILAQQLFGHEIAKKAMRRSLAEKAIAYIRGKGPGQARAVIRDMMGYDPYKPVVPKGTLRWASLMAEDLPISGGDLPQDQSNDTEEQQ